MKKVVIFLLFYSSLLCIGQQYKNTYWLSGCCNNPMPPNNPTYGGQTVLFNDIGIDTMYEDFRYLNFDYECANIVNKEGELVFYSNGTLIANENGDTVANAKILPIYLTIEDSAEYQNGYNTSPLFLPAPNDTNIYYFFYHSFNSIQDPSPNLKAWNLYCTTLDKRLNNGKGGVVNANQLVLQDTLDIGFQAVRHGNGRDWWLVIPTQKITDYYKILITPNGIETPILEKNTYFPVTYWSDIYANCLSVLSKDGTQLFRYDFSHKLIYWLTIDRCTGLFTEGKTIAIPQDVGYVTGIALSANDKVLYAVEGINLNVQPWVAQSIYKYDLTATNVSASRTLVGIWDGWGGMFAGFGGLFLGQDKNIYCVSNATYLHTIYNADDFNSSYLVQHNIQTPTISDWDAVPYYPNYALSALDGSACDTLGLSNQSAVSSKQVKIYPNPASAYVQVELPQGEKEATFVLYNALGQEVQRTELQASTLVRFHLPKGLYIYEVIVKGEKRYGKLQVE